ncbi:hypothetical protein ACFWVM_04245 [Nocardia fluminea]|uniref:hypothetical protein n=1 Tax=Nocardia fluminea TaxID=134984 RepID=UPI00364AD165
MELDSPWLTHRGIAEIWDPLVRLRQHSERAVDDVAPEAVCSPPRYIGGGAFDVNGLVVGPVPLTQSTISSAMGSVT